MIQKKTDKDKDTNHSVDGDDESQEAHWLVFLQVEHSVVCSNFIRWETSVDSEVLLTNIVDDRIAGGSDGSG